MSPPAIGTRATHIADETQNRSNRTVSSLWSPAVRRKVEPVSIGAVNIAVNVCPQPSLRHTDMVCRASGLDPPALRLCSCDLDLARVRHRVDQGEPRTGRRRDRRRSNTGRPGPGSGRARGGVVGPEELRPPCVSSPGRSVHSMALTVPAGRMPTVCRKSLGEDDPVSLLSPLAEAEGTCPSNIQPWPRNSAPAPSRPTNFAWTRSPAGRIISGRDRFWA